MNAARLEHAWGQTASLLAMLANCHRDPNKRSQPYLPDEFNPLRAAEEQAKPVRKIKIGDLARIVCDGERPQDVLAEVFARDARPEA
jgi:hypothetical protein